MEKHAGQPAAPVHEAGRAAAGRLRTFPRFPFAICQGAGAYAPLTMAHYHVLMGRQGKSAITRTPAVARLWRAGEAQRARRKAIFSFATAGILDGMNRM